MKRFDGNFSVSIDLAALARDQVQTIADVASGRITPAEANARTAETRGVLKAVEQAIKSVQILRGNTME